MGGMATNPTRQTLLEVGTELINRHGFTATGIEAVLKAADVPKGSFYHHFKSKEDFALAVVDGFASRLEQILRTTLEAEGSPLERLHRFLSDRMDLFVQNRCVRGCLLGNLGQELAASHPRLAARLQEAFDMWCERVADCLREAQARGELRADLPAGALAGFILSGFQGSLLRAKLACSPEPIREFRDTLFATVLHP